MPADSDIQSVLADLKHRIEAAAARSADPERARDFGVDILRAAAEADSAALRRAWVVAAEPMASVVASLSGASPFLVRILLRHPEWVARLATDDLTTQRTAASYRSRLDTLLAASSVREEDALRQFKYYELARITARDLENGAPESRAGEILAEISHLADTLLSAALRIAARRLANNLGEPVWRADGKEIPLRFCALGLGKLGSEELNYSSDVDLVYVFESPPGGATDLRGPGDLSPIEYFTRLARDLGRIVTETTGEGFLYRIDLDLRPEGSQGPLVVSSGNLLNYYELWAAMWEKAAFMKARPVAGAEALGWRTIRGIDPMLYRSAMDLAAVAAIRALKEKIERVKEPDSETFNVKLSSGGIRDVEFVAQALQLLHGGRIPQVRCRGTQEALVALGQVGVLPPATSQVLLQAYRFLRRVENLIQMEEERQSHRLPSDPGQVRRIARAMGYCDGDEVAAFAEALSEHRRRVRETFAELFHDSNNERVLDLFAQEAPALLGNPSARPLIEQLAQQFAEAIDASPDPERAMNNLARFIAGVGSRRFYYELLLDRPELVPRLATLFAASEYLSAYLASHPRLVEPIFSDPNVLLLTREQLCDAHRAICEQLAAEASLDDAEVRLDALRLFHNRELVNVGLLDVAGRVDLGAVEGALTDIAEVCIEEGLALAHREMARRSADREPPGRFLVVGMGKLASRELTYGSDLDVIFLYDADGDQSDLVEAQEYYVRLAQKLIWALRTVTREGSCYEIDARLRPSGNQGTLVTSFGGFQRYHAMGAQIWERQALLRARGVAGDATLALAFEQARRAILMQPLPADLRGDAHRIRMRMEAELARESSGRHDFKLGRGGLQDIETIVQILQLEYGDRRPDLLDVQPIVAKLGQLEQVGALGEADAATLRNAWNFLQRLSSRLRIVENRSISDLDEERGDLDSLAHRLGYTAQREGGARRALLEDYRRQTGAVRAVYERIIGG